MSFYSTIILFLGCAYRDAQKKDAQIYVLVVSGENLGFWKELTFSKIERIYKTISFDMLEVGLYRLRHCGVTHTWFRGEVGVETKQRYDGNVEVA